MKLADIEIGGEYAAHDNPTRSFGVLPRQVKVLEIVSEPEEYWSNSGFHSYRKTRNVKRVKVEFLSDPTAIASRYSYGREISEAKKGSTRVILTRQIVAPWEKVRDEVKSSIDASLERKRLEEEYETRIRALGFKGARRDDAWVDVSTWGGESHVEIRFSGKGVEKILKLAEGA